MATGNWFDDAGDTEPAKLIRAHPGASTRTMGNFGPGVYKTGSYGNLLCSAVETPELRLGTGSQLSFYSKHDIESSWDKGEVQVSV